MKKIKLIHAGEVLMEEFIKPLGITVYRLAKDTGLPQTRIAEIVKERRGISADTALRLGKYLGTTPQFWLNIQNRYDLELAAEAQQKFIDAIVPIQSMAA